MYWVQYYGIQYYFLLTVNLLLWGGGVILVHFVLFFEDIKF